MLQNMNGIVLKRVTQEPAWPDNKKEVNRVIIIDVSLNLFLFIEEQNKLKLVLVFILFLPRSCT